MRPLAALAVLTAALAAPAAADQWQTLYDGKSLSAFRCYNKPDIPSGIWSIEPDGSLKTVPGVKDGCDLITRDKYKDFEFEVEWKVPAKGNSGIVYRVVEVAGQAVLELRARDAGPRRRRASRRPQRDPLGGRALRPGRRRRARRSTPPASGTRPGSS